MKVAADRRGLSSADVTALGLIVVLGLINLPMPFSGDQALFSNVARELGDGAVYYRDFVDLKQPGIYLFYVIGQTIFGSSEVGIHFFELILLLAFSVVLQQLGRRWFTNPVVAATLPLPVVGMYYFAAEYTDLTQVEALVGIPLLAAVLLGSGGVAAEAPRWRFVAGGFAVGCVALLKFPYVLIPAATWLPMLIGQLRADWRRALRDVIAPTALGVAFVAVPFAIYFGAYGALDEFRYATFEWTPETLGQIEVPGLARRGIERAIKFYSPLLVLIGAGLVVRRRQFFDAVTTPMMVWSVLSLPLILVQDPWTYKYFLPVVPLGILAWFGLQAIVEQDDRRIKGAAVSLAIVALAGVGVMQGLDKVDALAGNGLGLTAGDRGSLRAEVNPLYDDALEWSAWNAEAGPADTAYAVGANPLFLYVSDHTPGFRVDGWFLDFFFDEEWERFDERLQNDPPERMVLEQSVRTTFFAERPMTAALVESAYCVARVQGPFEFLALTGHPACRS